MGKVDEIYGEFVRDNSIIEEYKRVKMRETIDSNINESKMYLDKVYKEIDSSEILEHEQQLYNLVKTIIAIKKEKITLEQKEVLCTFIANEAFWHLGSNKMLELIENKTK